MGSDTPPRVLMVCTGNICRSPVAAALLQKWAPGWGLRLRVESAGTTPQSRVPPETQRHARELWGLDLSRHRARGVTRELVEGSRLVLCAEEGHIHHLRDLAPGAREHTFTLWGFARGEDRSFPTSSRDPRLLREPRDLPDPYFMDERYARAALREIGEALEATRPRLV